MLGDTLPDMSMAAFMAAISLSESDGGGEDGAHGWPVVVLTANDSASAGGDGGSAEQRAVLSGPGTGHFRQCIPHVG